MRRKFGSEYLQEEFSRLGDTVDSRTEGYLIGGASMAFRGLKDATKDIDLVVWDRATIDRLQEGLHSLGYDTVRSPREEYAEMGTQAILENEDGCRFDLFVRQVVGEVIFTPEMRDRSEPFLDTGSLAIELVSPEDIFLFKSVAGRPDDIDDMNTLVQTGLDFDTIAAEIDRQIDRRNRELFVTRIDESLGQLEDQFGVTTPLGEKVGELSRRVYEQLEVLMAFDSRTTRDDLTSSVSMSQEALDRALDRLEEKGAVERKSDRIIKQNEDI